MRNLFREKLNYNKFTFVFEVDPPRGINYDETLAKLKGIKSDGICVGDNPLARLRMSALALGGILSREHKDVIMHLTCRDRTILGLQSEILGAGALGIKNILALTGDGASIGGEYGSMKTVFELNSLQLIGLIKKMNEGFDYNGKNLTGKTDFYIGAGTFFEVEKTMKKIEAGAKFFISQPVYELESSEKFITELEKKGIVFGKEVHLLLGNIPLMTEKHAKFLSTIPGISVPENLIKKIGSAKEKEKQEEIGINIAQELMDKIKSSKLAQGVCIMPGFGRYDIIRKLKI